MSGDTEPQIGTLPITCHVEYALRHPGSPEKLPLLIALHGWGQNCRGFIRRVAPLTEAGFSVVAPQAPHPLYVSMDPKKVGFSWLTMYERDRAVEEFFDYMERLIQTIAAEHSIDTESIYLLGFSQGVSMAHRLAASGRIRTAGLIAWAADLPPDVAEKLADVPPYPVLLVHATDDPIVTVDKSDEAEATLKAHHFPVERIAYEGGHVIAPEPLHQVGAWLRRQTGTES